MGGDGGTTANQRKFLVNGVTKTKKVRARRDSGNIGRCIVVDKDGCVYDGQEIIDTIKSSIGINRKNGLKLKECVVTTLDKPLRDHTCPIFPQNTFDSKAFIMIKTCKHLLSVESLKFVDNYMCPHPHCNVKYTDEDLIKIRHYDTLTVTNDLKN